jgi:hypothetical protein
VSLRDRIRAFLHPDLVAERSAAVILARLEELEEAQVHRELVFKQLADAVKRNVQKAAAIEQRNGGRNGTGAIEQRIFELKFPKAGS